MVIIEKIKNKIDKWELELIADDISHGHPEIYEDQLGEEKE